MGAIRKSSKEQSKKDLNQDKKQQQQSPKYLCKICGEQFFSGPYFKVHLENHKRNKETTTPTDDLKAINRSSEIMNRSNFILSHSTTDLNLKDEVGIDSSIQIRERMNGIRRNAFLHYLAWHFYQISKLLNQKPVGKHHVRTNPFVDLKSGSNFIKIKLRRFMSFHSRSIRNLKDINITNIFLRISQRASRIRRNSILENIAQLLLGKNSIYA